MQSQGYLQSAPANGMHANNLIGAKVNTADGKEVGKVSDLIIDEHGQIVAIVVGVGGFLGLGQKDVAIGWGHVTRSGASNDPTLRIDVSGDNLRSAPEFKKRD